MSIPRNLSKLADGASSTGVLNADSGGTGQTSYTDGQLLIGNTTGNTLTKATLTAGSGISVTNGNGSITIANTASVSAATPTALGTVYGNTNSASPNLTAIGYQASNANTGTANTAVGVRAEQFNTSGVGNTAVGFQALRNNLTGGQNTAIGSQALQDTTGDNNTAVGLNAGTAVTSGANNTFLGTSAGYSITTGSNNIVLGKDATGSSASVSNENTFGTSSTTSNRFWGDFKMGGSSAGTSGQVLTSAGAGSSPTWATPATPALTYASNAIGTNVSIGTSVTAINGFGITAGTWLVTGRLTYLAYSNISVAAQIYNFNTTTVYASSQGVGSSVVSAAGNITITTLITVASSQTIQLRAIASSSTTGYASTPLGSYANATELIAVKIA